MTRKHLLIGISTAALAAGTAQAQNRDTTDARGNREFVQCTAGNSCDVDNQIDNNPNNDRNLGAVRASAGTNNNLFVEQDGDDNTGTIDVRGNNNDADIDQDGDDNVARINISGDSNDAYIGQFGEDNLGLITIVGNGNYSYIRQGSFGSLADNNQAVTNQNGTNLDSFIRQGTFSGEAAGFNNSATVTQTGTGSDSNIRQYQSGNIARVSMSGGGDTYLAENYSYITQRNTLFQGTSTGGFTTDNGGPDSFNNPDTGNLADVAIAGQGNQSRVIQNGVQNRAIVSMLGGGSTTSTAVTGPNGGAIAAGRRAGNSSTVNQTGRGNFYEISSGGRAPSGVFGRGNVAIVNQGQNSSDGLGGTNHTATVFQRGTLDTVNITQDDNFSGPSGARQSGSVANVATLSLDSTVTVTQSGTNFAEVSVALNADNSGGQNRVSVNQTDAGDTTSGGGTTTDPFGGTGTTTVTTLRNHVGISQAGIGNVIDVQQNAINASVSVFQPRLSRNNTATIRQGTGDANAAVGPLGSTAGTGAGAQNLIVDVTQSNRGNVATINQDARDSRVVLTQQGTVPTASQTGANANGATGNVATINQINRFQSATVTQNGFNLNATVDQRATLGTTGLRNLVTVQQTGNGHSATARQLASAGATPECNSTNSNCPASGNVNDPTTFPNSRAAGTRYSAEIRIIQQGTTSGTTSPGNAGNVANVEQQGLGQYAEINQNGRGNNAGILQGMGATNAVAIIQQTGDGNTFFITQSAPGQFQRVVQNGNNNANTTVISAGPPNTAGGTAGGNNSSGTGATQPAL